jgi:hypothetical protein
MLRPEVDVWERYCGMRRSGQSWKAPDSNPSRRAAREAAIQLIEREAARALERLWFRYLHHIRQAVWRDDGNPPAGSNTPPMIFPGLIVDMRSLCSCDRFVHGAGQAHHAR